MEIVAPSSSSFKDLPELPLRSRKDYARIDLPPLSHKRFLVRKYGGRNGAVCAVNEPQMPQQSWKFRVHPLPGKTDEQFTGQRTAHTQNRNLPIPPLKHKKKPFVRTPRRGGFLVKKKAHETKDRVLLPPDNGLLVENLVPVAHAVFEARSTLIQLVSKMMEVIPVKVCKFCAETHIGPVGHLIATCEGPSANTRHARHVWTDGNIDDVVIYLDAFHPYDRLRTVQHEQRFEVDRIPALVELCIQAGVNLPEYPSLRRSGPVRRIGKRLIEEDEPLFEVGEKEEDDGGLDYTSYTNDGMKLLCHHESEDYVALSKQVHTASIPLLVEPKSISSLTSEDIAHMAQVTLNTWESMRSGTRLLMRKYPVKVCGYCPEVHIGPGGHRVRLCGAFKHQWRQGKHGWQEATIDDLIPPKYVWHVKDPQRAPLLSNKLRKYYGKTPAVVELCVQAGATVPHEFKALMRLDVAIPNTHEAQNAV